MKRLRSSLLLAALLIVGMCPSAWAKPKHDQFTGDLGLGFGLTLVRTKTTNYVSGVNTGSTTETNLKPGVAGISGSVGHFLNPNFALLLRTASTSYYVDWTQIANSFLGPVVEFWPHDRLFLSGGVGIGLFTSNPLKSQSGAHIEPGLAFDARIGTAFINARNHDLILSLEVIPSFYDQPAMSFGLLMGWKWY